MGVDIEDGRDLGTATFDVAVSAELSGLVSSGVARDVATAARLAFSLKEAIFKCQAPITGFQTLGFEDVLLRSAPAGSVLAIPNGALPDAVARTIAATRNIYLQLQGVTVTISSLP
jgi:4'-phosphopantetheinyl transferase EntD